RLLDFDAASLGGLVRGGVARDGVVQRGAAHTQLLEAELELMGGLADLPPMPARGVELVADAAAPRAESLAPLFEGCQRLRRLVAFHAQGFHRFVLARRLLREALELRRDIGGARLAALEIGGDPAMIGTQRRYLLVNRLQPLARGVL